MSLEYRILQPENHVRIVGSGNITPDELTCVINQVMADPRCSPESTALIDLRNATYRSDSIHKTIMVAKAVESFPDMLKGKIAIVAARSTLLVAEIISLHMRTVADVGIRVFLDIDAAEEFIQEECDGDEDEGNLALEPV